MGRGLLYHEVDGEQAEGAALAAPAMYKYGAVVSLGLLDEADDCVDDVLVDDVLDVVLCPVEGEEAHALDGVVVLGVPACAVDDMGDLVEGQPFDVLPKPNSTCAITSSPMKMQSVILTGIETSSGG